MAKKFSVLREKMSPEARERAEAKAQLMMRDMPLQELRKARGLSQAALADILDVSQAHISKIERRTDMYLSTLRSHIEAMGGRLDLVAHFPEGDVSIRQLAMDRDQPEDQHV